MPAKKHRSRHGNGNTVTTQSQPNPNLLQKLAVANNVNGNGTTTHNGYHQTIDEHQYKAVPINLNGTNGGGSGAYANCNGGIISSIIFTPKQQQQLDRNAFLLTLTKDQLKVECRKRGQKTTGTKTDLLQRVGFKMSLQQQQQKAVAQSNGNLLQKTPPKSAKMGNGSALSGNGTHAKKRNTDNERDRKEREQKEREGIVLWYHPIQTIQYSTLESVELLRTFGQKTLENKLFISIAIVLISVLSVLYHVPGNHQAIISVIRANLWFIVYWVGLGVLSSVGLGTGLHTFLLYLGPHIASVTLAAYECNSLNFPSPPYPDEIICPEEETAGYVPSLWSIMSKVRFEAFLWGAGTALGELPPYFMAKASRLSGYDPDDADDLNEFVELNQRRELGGQLSRMDRAKLFMEKIVEKVGFFGILAFASIPNPLFDLAGITCGHFLVPFWTFFGATLLGKAVIKMHIQKIFVIIAFSETLVEKAVDALGWIPWVGIRFKEPFEAFLANQKTRLHRSSTQPTVESKNVLAKVFDCFVFGMIVYFVISIINSLAQSYHKRIHKKKYVQKKKD